MALRAEGLHFKNLHNHFSSYGADLVCVEAAILVILVKIQ